jgi:hypothetical protein
MNMGTAGIVYGAYIVHNWVQRGCCMLPLEVEVLVGKTYKYFHICAVSGEHAVA